MFRPLGINYSGNFYYLPKILSYLASAETVHDLLLPLNSLKQTTKFSSAKNVKSKLYHIENSKTRGQTV